MPTSRSPAPDTAQRWLSVVGIGEDGLAGLSALARSHLDAAEIVVGGKRHLTFLPPNADQKTVAWGSPLSETLTEIHRYRGQQVCVLASGDPMCYGIGVTLLREFPLAEMTVLPAPSAFSLAAARLGWPLADVDTLSLCGRDPAFLNELLYPGAKLLILSADQTTPQKVAQRLTDAGYGQSVIHVFERMGGIAEHHHRQVAQAFSLEELCPLNLIAVECCDVAPGYPRSQSRLAGLPDIVYQHDGQLTKSEVRAMTLAALNPLPGQLLWDVGAGCGSISIEWLRSDRRCRAIAIESHVQRRDLILANAISLGTPNLRIVAGEAPAALADLPLPDAVFIGGGLTETVLNTCWQALKPGGILVTNTVTLPSEQLIYEYQSRWGGTLTRIAIQRLDKIGSVAGWRSLSPVTQWVVEKS